MKTIILFCTLLCSSFVHAQPIVHLIEPVANQDVTYKGNLSNGTQLTDLSWAWSSANACFPETQKSKFTGNHVFFTGVIPKYSEITVTVVLFKIFRNVINN